jgi:hypothetical protein
MPLQAQPGVRPAFSIQGFQLGQALFDLLDGKLEGRGELGRVDRSWSGEQQRLQTAG